MDGTAFGLSDSSNEVLSRYAMPQMTAYASGEGLLAAFGVVPAAAGSMARSRIIGKKTPISAFRECLKRVMRVKKMEEVRASAVG